MGNEVGRPAGGDGNGEESIAGNLKSRNTAKSAASKGEIMACIEHAETL